MTPYRIYINSQNIVPLMSSVLFAYGNWRLNWDSPSDKSAKTEAPCHSRRGTIKIPPCSKAGGAEHSF